MSVIESLCAILLFSTLSATELVPVQTPHSLLSTLHLRSTLALTQLLHFAGGSRQELYHGFAVYP